MKKKEINFYGLTDNGSINEVGDPFGEEDDASGPYYFYYLDEHYLIAYSKEPFTKTEAIEELHKQCEDEDSV